MNSFECDQTVSSLAALLNHGGVGVIPTDTIYGIVASALDPAVVERLYHLKGRNPAKPYIILIGSLNDLHQFDITPNKVEATILNRYWPGPYSIILNCPSERFSYLHRGSKSLAFRLPASKGLGQLLRLTGPLVAPSANPEGLPPAQTAAEAKTYFGDAVGLYVQGPISGRASTLIRLDNGTETILRP